MKFTLVTLSLPLAWILAPESLVLLGNIAGHTGMLLLLPLLIAGLLLMVASTESGYLECSLQNTIPAFGLAGSIAASTLALSGRIPVILLASTAMLVTAGFVFNEVFVYWFPNFGFAFLLLSLILLLNLIDRSWADTAQILFVSIALGGLLILIAIGLIGYSGSYPSSPRQGENSLSLFSGASCLLLFLGIDLHASHRQGRSLTVNVSALACMFLLAFSWGLVSQLHVPAEKLMNSTIPYTLAARSIAGDTGRFIIGAVLISGACGVVNGLFISCHSLADSLVGQRLAPGVLRTVWGGRILHILFALVIGVMMITGLAGEEQLETYLRGALLLWLLHFGLRPFLLYRHHDSAQSKINVLRLSVSLVFLLTFAYLLLADQQAALLLRFCVTALAGGLVLGVTALALGRMSTPEPPTQHLTEDAT